LPSGLSAECREHREQLRNKKEAFRKLSTKVMDWVLREDAKNVIPLEKSTETIRTYHAVENRVKDHASGLMQSYDEVMKDVSEMINARLHAKQSE